jgi:PKD repeat protein
MWLATDLALNPGSGGSTNQPPTAAFASSCSGLTCALTSSSSDPDGSISAYSWNFGDGGTSTAQNPSHTYPAAGTYAVTLTVTDNQGATNSVSHSVTVTTGNQPPVASFTSSCSGLTCSFTSTSSDPDGTITAYSWTFGDGGTSTLQNPSHTYAVGGTTYTVTLTVTDNQGATSSVSQPRHVRRR